MSGLGNQAMVLGVSHLALAVETLFHMRADMVKDGTERPMGRDNTPLGRVLLVDDEAEVLAATTALLETRGWLVETGRSVSEALDLLRADAARFTVLIVDYLLNDGSGAELMARMKEQGIKLPTIVCSGLDNHPTLASDIPPPHFLRKPYRLHELETALSSAIESNRG